MISPVSSTINDPGAVRRDYATEEAFLRRRLTTWADLLGPRVEDVAANVVGDGSAGRLLDVGCGPADFTERLASPAHSAVALDLMSRMVELAAARGLDAVRGDTQALPFVDAAFACVVANRVLYHLPDLDAGLGEIVRVLGPGGRLVVITYADDHLAELASLVDRTRPTSTDVDASILRRHFESVEGREITGTARFSTVDAIKGCLASYGEFSWFADVDVDAALAGVDLPFNATYRHVLYVASGSISSRRLPKGS